jgi:hypothetical protein
MSLRVADQIIGGKMSGNARNANKEKGASSTSKMDDLAQHKRFLEAAKKAEADETEEGADRAFKKVTSRPPKRRDQKS